MTLFAIRVEKCDERAISVKIAPRRQRIMTASLARSSRTIGLARARTRIGMANLAYNLRRLVQLRGCVPLDQPTAGFVCPHLLHEGHATPKHPG